MVLFYGTPNVRTVGFIDAIDDKKLELQNDTVWQMIRDTTDPNSLTSAFHYNIYPNVYNAETNENTGDPNKPNIDTTKLYTYDMNDGDALVFRTDSIPHIGYPPINRDGLRVSGESRYALLKRPLVISDAYVLTPIDHPSLDKENPSLDKENSKVNIRVSGDDGFWSELSLSVEATVGDLREGLADILESLPQNPNDIETENVRMWLDDEKITSVSDDKTLRSIGITTGKHLTISLTDVMPDPIAIKLFMYLEKVDSYPYINEQIEDIIYSYFREEFRIFLEVYNLRGLDSSQMERLPLDIELFERFMNEIPYDDYYYGQSEDEKKTTISQFLQKNLG